ncbi:MAG: hypothetical protein GY820_38960 [Gammaproteobacteria bacterium]|nr:hypothetical protein [Gammaproteobacteria bacterium]
MAKAQPKDAIPAGDIPPETPDKGEVVEPKVYAGTFKSADELEKGYGELKGKLDTQGGELGTLRGENKQLQDQMATMTQEAQGREEAARNATPPTDYEQELREVKKQFDSGDIDEDEYVLQTNTITANRVSAESDAKIDAMKQDLIGQFQNTLADRDTQVVVDKFHKDNPDFATLQADGTLARLQQDNPMLDEVSAYYSHQAQTAFDKGKADQERIERGSDNAGKVLSEPGSAMQTPGSKPTTEAELKASMLKAATG